MQARCFVAESANDRHMRWIIYHETSLVLTSCLDEVTSFLHCLLDAAGVPLSEVLRYVLCPIAAGDDLLNFMNKVSKQHSTPEVWTARSPHPLVASLADDVVKDST